MIYNQEKLLNVSENPNFEQIAISLKRNMEQCKTIATPIYLKDRKTGKTKEKPVIVYNHCNNRLCPHCQGRLFKMNYKRIKKRIKHWRYFSFLTLTIDKNLNLFEGRKYIFAQLKRLLKQLGRQGFKINDYIAVYELTYNDKIQRWHHHLHVIMNIRYIPYDIINEQWHNGFIFFKGGLTKDGSSKYIAKYISHVNKNINLLDYAKYQYKKRNIIGNVQVLVHNKAITETKYYVYFDQDEQYLTIKGVKYFLHHINDGGGG
jgi:hypothetical protein